MRTVIFVDSIAEKMADIELEQGLVLTEQFETVREHIETVSGESLLGVFHIGSTAIPDLAAKPMVDVLAVYSGSESAREVAETLVRDGYTLRKDEPEWIQLVGTVDRYDVFVHFRPEDSDVWRDQLVVREYLRENPEARREYERVKLTAVEQYEDRPEEYTAAKDDVVRTLEDRAYEEGFDERIPNLG